MRNNILGGLVIFMVVLTCLLMIDDISSAKNQNPDVEVVKVEESNEHPTDLAIIKSKE
jgi:hypothetical protein